MTQARQINIEEIVGDIRSKMTDHDLMVKYKLSAKGLLDSFNKLVELKALDAKELEKRVQSVDDAVFFKSMRDMPRHYLVIPIPVIAEGNQVKSSGNIRDITEKGLGTVGIEAKIGETKTFSVPPSDFLTVPPFSFSAVCRWMDNRSSEGFIGGFMITEISEEALGSLRQLISDLTFGES